MAGDFRVGGGAAGSNMTGGIGGISPPGGGLQMGGTVCDRG